MLEIFKPDNVSLEVIHFNDLNVNQLHDIISLRISVFVIEQNCIYPELDGKDKAAHHVLLSNEKQEIIGTARILSPGVTYPEVSIGRVVVAEKYRQLKFGHLILQVSLGFIEKNFGRQNIRMSAQTHLTAFYETHGFQSTGKCYLEDGIPHTEMSKNIKTEK